MTFATTLFVNDDVVTLLNTKYFSNVVTILMMLQACHLQHQNKKIHQKKQ